jgi:hypothetical protein
MRPSHMLHTFLVANLRLVLDVQMSSGKQHTSGHAKAAPRKVRRLHCKHACMHTWITLSMHA